MPEETEQLGYEAAILIAITRLYDVTMAVYREMDASGAARLLEFHEAGGLVSGMPKYDPGLNAPEGEAYE